MLFPTHFKGRLFTLKTPSLHLQFVSHFSQFYYLSESSYQMFANMPARSIQTIGDHSNLLVIKAIIRRFSPTDQSINILLATGGSKRATNQSLALCEWGFSHLTLPLIYKWLIVMGLQNPKVYIIYYIMFICNKGTELQLS